MSNAAHYRRTYVGGDTYRESMMRLRGTQSFALAKMLTQAKGLDFTAMARETAAADDAKRALPEAMSESARYAELRSAGVEATEAWRKARGEHRNAPRSTPSTEGVNTFIAKLQDAYTGLTSEELRDRLRRLEQQEFSCPKRKRLALRTCRRALADAETHERELRERAAARWDMPEEPTIRRNDRNSNSFRSAFGAE